MLIYLYNYLRPIALGLIGLLIAACTLADIPQVNIAPFEPSRTVADLTSEPVLPLRMGTTWVYSYMPYDPLPADPLQTMTATYLMTETVVAVQTSFSQTIAKIHRERQLVWQPVDWIEGDKGAPEGFWYVISGTVIYESWADPKASLFNPEEAMVAYRLPLTVGQRWCPRPVDLKDPANSKVINCEASGERRVIAEGVYETPAGSFGPCYEITEAYTSGGVRRRFCPGVGLIGASYDHGGTRFGYRLILVRFKPG